VRFLRKARELAYRDLGGLVFNLHRFGQRNDTLVLAKLGTLTQIDTELRSLEAALSEHQPVTVMREAGIAACPRCAAIHSGEDRFCPNCGLPMDRHVDLPIAGATPVSADAAPTPDDGAAGGTPSPSPSPVPEPAPVPETPAAASSVEREAPAPAGAGGSPGGPPVSEPGPSPVPAQAPVQEPARGEEPTAIIRPPAAGA
jgi:hypothetical protein